MRTGRRHRYRDNEDRIYAILLLASIVLVVVGVVLLKY